MNVSQAPKWLPQSFLPFFTLSYPTTRPTNPDSYPTSNYYGTGRLDGCFVLTWILLLGILRECLRLGVMEPFARNYLYRKDMAEKGIVGAVGPNTPVANGDNGDKKATLPANKNVVNRRPKGMNKATWKRERSAVRFAEQGWQFSYYVIYWSLGLYIHYRLPSSPFQLDKLWLNYPHTPVAGPVKFYYLTQLAFWFHQALLLNAEAWRNDHVQMMSHHVITIFLVIASYSYNFTRVGVLVMVLMDLSDILLAVVKICRYLRFPDMAASIAFGFYAISWIITRHVLFITVICSIYKDAPRLIPFKWAPERGHYLTRTHYIVFVCLMVALQAILCIWLVMIGRIVWNVLRGNPPEDTRSGGEEESDDEDAEHFAKKEQ